MPALILTEKKGMPAFRFERRHVWNHHPLYQGEWEPAYVKVQDQDEHGELLWDAVPTPSGVEKKLPHMVPDLNQPIFRNFIIVRLDKDEFEQPVEAFLSYTEMQARQQPPMYEREWAEAFKKAYEQWKSNDFSSDAIIIGTPLVELTELSEPMRRAYIERGVMSIEALAEASEQTLNHLGLGGRANKVKAQRYLALKPVMATESFAKELADVKAALATKDEQIALQSAQITEMLALVRNMVPGNVPAAPVEVAPEASESRTLTLKKKQ